MERAVMSDWWKTVRGHLKAHAAGEDPTQTWEEIVTQAEADEGFLRQLDEAKRLMDEFPIDQGPESDDAFERWLSWHSGAVAWPDNLRRFVFGRLHFLTADPERWEQLLFDRESTWLPEDIVSRPLVKKADLDRLAEADPGAFFNSSIPDILVKRGLVLPDVIWEFMLTSRDRPEHLLPTADLVVGVLHYSKKSKPFTRFVELISEAEEIRSDALSLLLEDMSASARVLEVLQRVKRGGEDDTEASRGSAITQVVVTWAQLAKECALSTRKDNAQTAALVLSSLTLALEGLSESFAEVVGEDGAEDVKNACRALALGALSVQEGHGQDSGVPVITLPPKDLHEVINEHLQQLPKGDDGFGDSSARISAYERFKGRREVLEEILYAIDEEPAECPLRDALEIALYNVGVRTIGEVGEQADFDSTMHKPQAQAILPGESCTVVHTGQTLGQGKDQVILRRATVEPIE